MSQDLPPPPEPGVPDPNWAERFAPPMPSADITAYLRANAPRYTREALDQRLVASGHPPEAIAAAWATVLAEDAASGLRDRRGQTATIIAIAYAATWLLVVLLFIAPSATSAYSSPAILAGILAVALFLPAFLAVLLAMGTNWLRRASVGRVVAFSFVPLLVLFALAGSCISFTQQL
jgi:hypothetical protein